MIGENKTEETKVEKPVEPVPEKIPENIPEWAKTIIEKQAILATENEALKELAGKNALASLEESKRDFSKKKAHFKMMDGKVIIGWEKLDDSKFVVDMKDPHKENLFMNVKYLDGSEGRIEFIRFIRCTDLIYADVVNYGILVANPFADLKVKFPNDPEIDGLTGQEINVSFKFLNA